MTSDGSYIWLWVGFHENKGINLILMSLVMVKLIYVGKMSVWIFCVRVMARLVVSGHESQLDCRHCLTGCRWCERCSKTQNSKGVNKLEDGQHPNHKQFFELKSNVIHLLWDKNCSRWALNHKTQMLEPTKDPLSSEGQT